MDEQQFNEVVEAAQNGKKITLDQAKEALEWMLYFGAPRYPGSSVNFWLGEVRDLLDAVEE